MIGWNWGLAGVLRTIIGVSFFFGLKKIQHIKESPLNNPTREKYSFKTISDLPKDKPS